jgi:hypothetical protein
MRLSEMTPRIVRPLGEWEEEPRPPTVSDAIRAALADPGAQVTPADFESYGRKLAGDVLRNMFHNGEIKRIRYQGATPVYERA